jgi:hypothetical protein
MAGQYDAYYYAHSIAPWAARFRQTQEPLGRLIGAYERRLWHVTQEFQGLRDVVLDQQGPMAEKDRQIQTLQEKLQRARPD